MRTTRSLEFVTSWVSCVDVLRCYSLYKRFYILDDNVDVIYVSPVPVTEETLQYYSKLFGLRTAIETGDATNQSDVTARYKIVIPEALNSFPVRFNPPSLYKMAN